MELATTHKCWHGPYDSFSRWRNHLAKAAGYTLKPVTYGAGHTFDKVDIDWHAIERENPGCYNGDWLVPPTDALMLLIAHSDCEGHLKAADCSRLADRLQTLLLLLDDGGENHRAKTQRFIDGLREAAGTGEDVEFH